MRKRKLIEVALPLEAINRESAREKSIRHGHPSTLHLWWARRPLAAARAVLFAQLVDDPSSRPEEFPTEELQRKERERLHKLIERLVVWENARDEKLFAEAYAEILNSTNDYPPPILDPFAGGGSIPLEAKRLGLEAYASDLNPVAVLINKALIELPPKFHGQLPVFPGLADSEFRVWKGTQGLAADVRAYGAWMGEEAEDRIGHLYPKAHLPDGSKATVIAWIWARSVTCPNPACRIEMPLVRSWWLGKKKGKEAYVVPSVVADPSHTSGYRVKFEIGHDTAGMPTKESDGTMSGRKGGSCIACGSLVSKDHIKSEGMAGRMGATLMAVVTEGKRQRIYISPTEEHVTAAQVERPNDVPEQELGYDPRNIWTPQYGLTKFSDLFTNRQLVALTTFSDLISEARDRVLADGGKTEYADAVSTYLGLVVSKMTDRNSTLVNWYVSRESTSSTFARQALPMVWDFAEVEPLGANTGSFSNSLLWTAEAIEGLCSKGGTSISQSDAASRRYNGVPLSTDPPYYDNISYSDLSDYFYVWLRRSLWSIYPDLFATVLVPKEQELVANPYRHGGKAKARKFFEDGFRKVFTLARNADRMGLPITVYYAFKQNSIDETGKASTGWETFLESMIHAGWEITSTWPLRSELSNRMLASGTNSLASSIVLSLRPCPKNASTTDRRGFIRALEAELPEALRKMQHGQISPVDLPQAAIGPGMAVFSRYAAVIENDGSKMSVRSALARINEVLDQVLSEQEGDFDETTRFAVTWYRQHGYGAGEFGNADSLARARNTSVDTMSGAGILTSRASKVQLIRPLDLPKKYHVLQDGVTSNWEALHHLVKIVERNGIPRAGEFLHTALSRSEEEINADIIKELGHLLFRISENHGWAHDALSFNNLVTSWPEILEAARSAEEPGYMQPSLNLPDEDN
ncbi:DUF1156 domain-containing protein [Stackebrandtia nassauensis]|uniref:DUF1156 domain-containing protein n=1 Tax=Stackebrandtia nassauensis (strain DSM 44728 / CIP 108903 / NRRL B-16338 / NBRC 102104 / LLR-40K-21) TaxID=446470 RepID=D3PWE0_STANL|nr:DUF1156 domain-containing protein [Stackebrandtia nassauensis]ADD41297.1 protein of unknown function DUF1156 [Stackebrandtia nassauensis DSM 44728]